MSYHYRCMKCRGRTVLKKAVEDFRDEPVCKHCKHEPRPGGTRYYVDKERVRRSTCTCDGGLIGRTGAIPHRPGSRCCILHPKSMYYRAAREGASAEDLMQIELDMAWDSEGGKTLPIDDSCPF